jgi:Na+:H+ antiporter, NhaA family
MAGSGGEGAPPDVWDALRRLAARARAPIDAFLSIQAASGILLLSAALVALLWANCPWKSGYFSLFQTELGLRVGAWSFTRNLGWVINDGLMVIFFFVVGLEIRREIHEGELSEARRASLPLAAALGGMVLPALIYSSVVTQPAAASGWGVPMATDIAFAVGVLTLLGKRCPPALRVLLLAVAVIDDLGAILVIAVFYSGHLHWAGLGVGALGLALTELQKRLGVQNKLAYVPAGLLAWAGVYASGVHPTIAGVLLGLLTPVQARLGRDTVSPAESLIHTLHPWVAFGIMPLFALANAGVTVDVGVLSRENLEVSLAVILGLVIGKPVGVLLMCGLFVGLGWAVVPARLGFSGLVVLGLVAGIGFTMSLFIAELAFEDELLLGAAKLGVLGASALAGVLGALGGRFLLRPTGQGEAGTATEANRSSAP